MQQKIRSAEGLLRNVPKPGEVILPVPGEKNVLITSALPYCNNVPHLGNIIGSTLSADVFSRYNRTRNRRTLYICGTDEYGTATETQALKEGISPKELCDKYHVLHRETYNWFEIAFDYFGRTSTPSHTEICQGIYTNLSKNNLLEKQTKEQTYCEGCSKFLADRFVEGICPHCGSDDARGDQCDTCSRTLDAVDLINPRCLVDKTHIVTTKISAHMYVKLDTVQARTEAWIQKSYGEGKWSPNAVINTEGQIIDARLKGGLRPSPVTRDLQWGVPVPALEGADNEEMEGKVLYVWFDAPIGYPSITANYSSEWEKWWLDPDNVRLFQFMGKDNVYFHTVFFPSIQLGDGRSWVMLHHLSTTEYLNYEGGKFSKSHNRGIFGPAARSTGVPVSVWRFYLLWNRPENQDSMFSWDDCISANNNILLKNFGNFVNRALSFVAKSFDGVLPEGETKEGPLDPSGDDDSGFISDINALLTDYINAMEAVKLRLGLQIVMQISARGNLYLQAAGLSTALKTSDPKRCGQVVCRALNLIYILSVVVEPYMPATAASILSQLNAPSRAVPERFSIDILPGHHIGEPAHLFKRIDEKQGDLWKAQFAGTKAVTAKVGDLNADATHVQSAASKRKVAAAKKAPEVVLPPNWKNDVEIVAAQEKVTSKGDAVRTLKAQKMKSKEADEELAKAIAELNLAKVELAEIVQKVR